MRPAFTPSTSKWITRCVIAACSFVIAVSPLFADEKTADKSAAKTSPPPATGTTGLVPIPNRPKVPGTLRLRLRSRAESAPKSGEFKPVEEVTEWKASETAIIICDMWNNHYCQSAAQRVDMMAPRMNEVITAARNHGVMIIHAPSGTMDQYADTPYRRRMQQAKHFDPPAPLKPWCHLDPKKEPEIPVDVSKEPCDDPVVGPAVKVFDRQHAGIKMIGYDGVSDSGEEIYNFLRQENITNVVLMGVHTNMCVLGRPFGIRQLKYLGFNVALARDLTDAMYDPRQPPHVSHTRGTELVIEHIERHWCPSILGEDLTRVVPGSDNPPSIPTKTAPAAAAGN